MEDGAEPIDPEELKNFLLRRITEIMRDPLVSIAVLHRTLEDGKNKSRND